jgi:hypothetical protein
MAHKKSRRCNKKENHTHLSPYRLLTRLYIDYPTAQLQITIHTWAILHKSTSQDLTAIMYLVIHCLSYKLGYDTYMGYPT